MRGRQHHGRRAGVVSAGTLALVLTGAVSPAHAEEQDPQSCEDGEGLLSTVTGVVCDTTETLTDTTTEVLDQTTGGTTGRLGDGVKDVTGEVTGTVHDTVRKVEGTGGRSSTPPASGPGRSSDGGAGSNDGGRNGGNVGAASAGGSRDGRDGRSDDERPGRTAIGGSPASAAEPGSGGGGAGGGEFPHLQPLSPLAGLGRPLDGGTTRPEPELPRIAPSPSPSPVPTPPAEPGVTQYVAPTGTTEGNDRGEATPALMVLFAIIAAGVVTGGHAAIARARIRSRRVA